MEISYRELMDMVLRNNPEKIGSDNDWITLMRYAYERGRLVGVRDALEIAGKRFKMDDELINTDSDNAWTESLGECTWQCDLACDLVIR